MSYDSKYTGRQVEELLEKAGTALQSVPEAYVTATELEGKSYATTEAVNTSLAAKVDKVAGKQLTTEDFTTTLKQKLEGLSNYDDTAISEAVDKLRKDFDTLVSGDSTTAIKTFNEIVAFLSGIEDSESLDSIIASIEQQIAGKQDTIADLATIREGAGKGATAVQPSSLAKVATSGSYADLSGKPTIPTTLAGLTGDSTHRTVTDTEKATWNAKSNFSGSYNDLTNKPTIPAEQVNADWNATSGKAQILNKPTIPTVPTKVSKFENDAKYITEAAIEGLNASFVETDGTADEPETPEWKLYADENLQPKGISFSNVEASAWVASTTYEDFAYQCDVACAGVTADDYAEVVFNLTESVSGDYAPLCETLTDAVRIYSKSNAAITIPTIIITK